MYQKGYERMERGEEEWIGGEGREELIGEEQQKKNERRGAAEALAALAWRGC